MNWVSIDKKRDVTRADTCRDRGVSLIELVVAVSLMGLVVVGLLSAMWSSVRMSDVSDDQAKIEAALGSAADRLANFAYIPCPTIDGSSGYLPIVQAAAGTVNWPVTSVTITDLRFWLPSSTSQGQWVTANNLTQGECNEAASLTTSRTLQRITIKVTSPSGYSKSLEVVKNNVFPKAVTNA